MAELIRTNDVALISVVEGLLQEAEIPCHIADRHTSGLEGYAELAADARARPRRAGRPTRGSC